MLTLNRIPLGTILMQDGAITQSQLDHALAEQRRANGAKRIGEVLIGMRAVSEAVLLTALSKQLDCPLVDLNHEPPDAEALKIVPSEFALRHQLLPLHQSDHTLVVAMADPLDIHSIDDLRLLTGFEVDARLASPTDIRRAVEQFFMSQMI